MKNVLFTICIFAILTAGLVSAAHAHIEKQDITTHQIELNIDQDNTDTDLSSDALCDMHCHNHMSYNGAFQSKPVQFAKEDLFMTSNDLKPSLIYGFKRPPKS